MANENINDKNRIKISNDSLDMDLTFIFNKDYSKDTEYEGDEAFSNRVDVMIKNSDFLSSKNEHGLFLCKELIKTANFIAKETSASICVCTEKFANTLSVDIYSEYMSLSDELLIAFRRATVYCNSICFSTDHIGFEIEFDRKNSYPRIFS